jgi:hypothetical protein
MGVNSKNALVMAMDEINQKGGVNGLMNSAFVLHGDHEHFGFGKTLSALTSMVSYQSNMSTCSRPAFGTPRLQGEGGFSFVYVSSYEFRERAN